MKYTNETFICHYGIKGQQWGVRRFQNPDGTLTPEGKRRYSIYESAKKELIDAHADSQENAEGWERDIKWLKSSFNPNSKKGQESFLQRQYGDDWKDSEYMRDVWEIDDVYEHAKNELKKANAKYQEKAKEARQKAKRYLNQYNKLSKMSIEDLTDDNMKELEQFVKRQNWNLGFLDE